MNSSRFTFTECPLFGNPSLPWENPSCAPQKVQGVFGETFILALLSSAAFRLQNCVSDFF